MKAILLETFATVLLLLASVVQSPAIEGLQLSVQCTNVVLAWQGVEGDVYIIQSRPDLSTNSSWICLTNSFPAASGTNLTVFIDYGAVSNGNCGGSTSMQQDAFTSGRFSMNASSADGASFGNASNDLNSNWPPLPPLPLGFQYAQADSGQVTIVQTTWDQDSTESALDDFSGFGLPIPGGSPTPDDSTNSPQPVQMTFYQVVKAGVHLYGITNGVILSGIVSLPVEIGNTDANGNLEELFLSDSSGTNGDYNGTYFADIPDQPKNRLVGQWDTTQVTNGTYTIQLGAMLDDETYYYDHPVAVTVSNLIWFPDPWNVGGQGIYIGAQTPYTDGTGIWQVDAWDDQGNYVGYFPGIIETNGYLSYPGNTNVGFSIRNTDDNGNQLPSTYYTLVFQGDANHPLAASPPYTFTNQMLIEPQWNYFPTSATVCYMNPFSTGKPGYDEVYTWMEDFASSYQNYHQLTIGSGHAFEVGRNGTWGYVVTNGLQTSLSRDFIYFGHGGPVAIGPAGNFLKNSDVATDLTNNLQIHDDPLKGPNYHSYRFVFLNGCETADGNWPQAFGIPRQQNMKITDFTSKRGIRPRAFMGWKSIAKYTDFSTGQLDPNLQAYTDNFWKTWESLDTNGYYQTLTNSISQAGLLYNNNTGTFYPNPAAGGMVLYGANDLDVYY